MASDNNLAMHHRIEDELRAKLFRAEAERDALRAQVAAMKKALQALVYDCREVSGLIGFAERKRVVQSGASEGFMTAIQKAEAAIAAAERSAE